MAKAKTTEEKKPAEEPASKEAEPEAKKEGAEAK